MTVAPAAAQPDDAGWETYKQRFVTADGRVVDTGNGGISHSEGQGWGMLLAEAFGDRATFDRLWSWTTRSLRWYGSGLHAWKWTGGADPVPESNNATDGDLLIAWALERAGRRWGEPAYAAAAARIAADIRGMLTARVGPYGVLLPGFEGFEYGAAATVNLSYYVFPAFAALARVDPSPRWAELREDGLRLLGAARYGAHGLPPDWLTVSADGGVMPATKWPARFGFDAVRIPLYLIWGGLGSADRLAPFRTFWNAPADAPPPSWAGLDRDAAGAFRAPPGMRAVAALVDRAAGGDQPFPPIGPATDYYSASLILLAEVAAREAGLRGGRGPKDS